MTAEELMASLVKAGVLCDTIDIDYDEDDNWVEKTGIRTAGCGCCSLLADVPDEVHAMYYAALNVEPPFRANPSITWDQMPAELRPENVEEPT